MPEYPVTGVFGSFDENTGCGAWPSLPANPARPVCENPVIPPLAQTSLLPARAPVKAEGSGPWQIAIATLTENGPCDPSLPLDPLPLPPDPPLTPQYSSRFTAVRQVP